jgi:hypothetical protein
MGYWKERQEAELARGFKMVGQFVCARCVDDPYLKAYIGDAAVETTCDFCGRTASERIAADADDIIDFVREAIGVEFADPADELMFDEGDYVGDYCDTADLLERLGNPLGDGAFNEAVVVAGSDSFWCERDYYGDSLDDELLDDWGQFVETVKHEARYLFLALAQGRDDDRRFGRRVRRGGDMLAAIGRLILHHDLMQPIGEGTPLYRVRTSDVGKTFRTAADLGSPPRDKAPPNRMSPAGISMFYGALDPETALAEARGPDDDVASVADFRSTGRLWIADLERLPEVPSLFDRERRENRAEIRFLHRFAETLALPVARDGREHIDYVPTQIVCEYLRHVSRDWDNEGTLDGLAYRPTKVPGGRCVVLFMDGDRCLDRTATAPESPPALRLADVQLRSL